MVFQSLKSARYNSVWRLTFQSSPVGCCFQSYRVLLIQSTLVPAKIDSVRVIKIDFLILESLFSKVMNFPDAWNFLQTWVIRDRLELVWFTIQSLTWYPCRLIESELSS